MSILKYRSMPWKTKRGEKTFMDKAKLGRTHPSSLFSYAGTSRSARTTMHCLISMFVFLIFLCLAGCESLPPGTPPTGTIVSINTTNDNALSPDNAINDMTTALATCPQLYSSKEASIVGLHPSKILEKEYEIPLRSLTANLYRNLNEMDIITPPMPSKPPKYLIASHFWEIPNSSREGKNSKSTDFRWEIQLVSPLVPSKAIWQQKVNVRLEVRNKK